MLSYPQLVLGCQIEVEHIDGTKHLLKVPKGCPVGKKLIIPNIGFPNLRTKKRGDLVIITQCYIPKKTSVAAKDLLTTYDKESEQPSLEENDSIIGWFKKFLG